MKWLKKIEGVQRCRAWFAQHLFQVKHSCEGGQVEESGRDALVNEIEILSVALLLLIATQHYSMFADLSGSHLPQ